MSSISQLLSPSHVPISYKTILHDQKTSSTTTNYNASDRKLLRPAESVSTKRELLTNERAIQNRAAQQAFRLRKERYVKMLEQQLRNYQAISENLEAMEKENCDLRSYIATLETRLLQVHSAPISTSSGAEVAFTGVINPSPVTSMPYTQLGIKKHPGEV